MAKGKHDFHPVSRKEFQQAYQDALAQRAAEHASLLEAEKEALCASAKE